MSEPKSNTNDVTIVVTPRERFGVAVESLESVIEFTPPGFELIYVDGGTPKPIASQLEAMCAENGFRYIRRPGFLSPNEARNIGQRAARGRMVVFLDNDVLVSSGWLEALVTCADETGADVVAPLTCQKLPAHSEIHQAGGEFTDRLEGFFERTPDERRITDVHLHQGEKRDALQLERGPTQCCEFHCALVRKSVFTRWGDLDERLLATKEHIDFCMTVHSNGGSVVFEPASIVTYVFPGRQRPLRMSDWPYFILRWSPTWQADSLKHFQEKWDIGDTAYFRKRDTMLEWRYTEGVVKPLLRQMPLIGNNYTWKRLGSAALLPVLRLWSNAMAASHRRRRALNH